MGKVSIPYSLHKIYVVMLQNVTVPRMIILKGRGLMVGGSTNEAI